MPQSGGRSSTQQSDPVGGKSDLVPLLLSKDPHFTKRRQEQSQSHTVSHQVLWHLTSHSPLDLISCYSAPLSCCSSHTGHTRHTPSSGPLHWLFPVPGMLSPRCPCGSLPHSFESLLKCSHLCEDHPDHFKSNCKPFPTTLLCSTFPLKTLAFSYTG